MKSHNYLAAVLLSTSLIAFAADINTIALGDVYYIWQPDRPNARVTVREIDYRNSRVKVAYPDGEVRWESATRLQTRSEATGTDIGVGAAVLGGALLFCALSPDSCKSKPTLPPSGSSDSASDLISGLYITNSCRHPIRIAVSYPSPGRDKEWTDAGWWNFAPGQSSFLADSSQRKIVPRLQTWFYYAEAADSNIAWKGSAPIEVDGKRYPMAVVEYNKKLELTCNGL